MSYQVDATDRREYNAAMEIVPELVRRESRAIDFWVTENGNVAAAALRLARYWKARKQVFAERWLLPMNQTGTGALNMVDIAMLRTGFLTVVPRPAEITENNDSNKNNNPGCIALYNEGKLSHSPQDGLLRCIFYLVYAHGPIVQNTTFLHVVTSEKRPPLDLDPHRWMIQRTALPMKVTKVLVAQSHEFGKEALIDFVAYQLWRATSYKSKYQLDRIAADSIQGTLQSLTSRGLPAQCLPHCLGGQYDQQRKVADWVRMRLSIEGDVLSCPAALASLRYRPCAVAQVTQMTALSHRGALTRTCEDLVRRKATPQKSGGCRKEAATKTTTTTTTNNTTTATTTTTTTTTAPPPSEIQRQRNALYSRRSFNKRKLEILTLQNQTKVLQLNKERLLRENAELEQALAAAKRLTD